MRRQIASHTIHCGGKQVNGFYPNASAWRDFIEMSWDRKPAFLKFDGDLGFTSEDVLWQAVIEATRAFRNGTAQNIDDLYLGTHKYRYHDATDYLPSGEERNFDEYLGWLCDEFGDQQFAFLLHGIQQYSPTLWRDLRLAVGGMLEALGAIPAGPINAGLMWGRYAISPFQVHKDMRSVITFAIKGQKRFLVWPFEALANQTQVPDAKYGPVLLPDFDYQRINASAIELQIESNCAVYWPAEYWHVGESKADIPYVSLHLSFDVNKRNATTISKWLVSELERSAGLDRWHHYYRSEPALPGEYRDEGSPIPIATSLDRLLNELDIDSIRKSSAIEWLAHVSAQGFELRPVVHNRPSELSDRDTVALCEPFRPLWVVLGDTVLVGTNGRVLELPNVPSVRKVLCWLERGLPISLTDLVKCGELPHSAPTTEFAEEIKRVLGALVTVGAIRTL